ncbi:MAG: hypothetical protein B6229_09335 [Spirochaetaceae bacterium 4572_7]|nr:MAG: hypothetical protein B6229_09335 [Spirochaetaceae bacterium 4572_7]
MKKLTKLQIGNTTLRASYVLLYADGIPTIKGLRIFPGSPAEELTEVLSDNAIKLLQNGIAKNINEDKDDISWE